MSSSACFCFGVALACTVKLCESSSAPGVQQVLRVMAASSPTKVEKLCTGVSSSRLYLLTSIFPVKDGVLIPLNSGLV